jgi:hypothetical protein
MSEKEGNDENGSTKGLLKKILDRENMNKAYQKGKPNKGKHGIYCRFASNSTFIRLRIVNVGRACVNVIICYYLRHWMTFLSYLLFDS